MTAIIFVGPVTFLKPKTYYQSNQRNIMKKLFFVALVSLSSLLLFAQDKVVYDANAEVRPVTSFHAVKIADGIELLLKQGNEEAVAVSADEIKYRDAIKTEVVNGELRIYIKQDAKSWWKQLRSKDRKMKAYVSFKSIDNIDASSGSRTTIDGNLNTATLSIDVSSGATVKGNLKSKQLTIDQSSGGKTYISGDVENLEVNASSGAQFYGYDLVANKCKADASSGGKLQLNVSKEMVAHASSGGGINYKGEGAIMDISTSSGGKIRRDR